MSGIGKTFVVINLFLAAVVVAGAGSLLQQRSATQADLDEANGQIASLEGELEQTLSDARAEKSQLELDKSSLQETSDDLDVEVRSLQNANASLEQANQQLRDDVTKIQQGLDSLTKEMSTLQRRNQDLGEANDRFRAEAQDAADAQRRAETAANAARDELAAAEQQLADMQSSMAGLTAQLRDAEGLLEVAKAAGFTPTDIIAAPLIEAQVASVDAEYNFVILNKGADSNVERGYVFEIYSGKNYKGQVRVDQVHPNYATAQIEFVTDGMSIERFDSATTHL